MGKQPTDPRVVRKEVGSFHIIELFTREQYGATDYRDLRSRLDEKVYGMIPEDESPPDRILIEQLFDFDDRYTDRLVGFTVTVERMETPKEVAERMKKEEALVYVPYGPVQPDVPAG